MTVRRLFLPTAIALFVVLGRPAAAAESPVGKVIADVVPVGLVIHAKEHVLAKMGTKPGKAYDEATIQEDLRRLIGTRWFQQGQVRIETSIGGDGKVTVYVVVKEHSAVVKEVAFVGNQHMSPEELSKIADVRKGSPADPASNQIAAQTIENKYKEDGRYYATVSVAEGNKPSDTKVVFNIVEGPTVKVRYVSFRGNKQIPSDRLATKTTMAGPLWGVLRIMNTKFMPAQAEEDKKKLLDYLHKLGHLEAKVQEEVIPSGDLSSVDVVFHIEEGPVYTVRGWRIEGNKLYTAEQLRKLVELKPGGRYDRDVATIDEKRIELFYGHRGFDVRDRVIHKYYVVPEKPGTVDIVYMIGEPERRAPADAGVVRTSHQVPGGDLPPLTGTRDPDRVGNIRIVGNTVTHQDVILNELREAGILPGQILQYPSLEVAKLNLMRRGLFEMQENPPTVEIAPSNFDSIYKDVVVTVKETRTGQFLIGAAVNSNSGLNGNIVVNERNFDILRIPTSFDDLINGRAFKGQGQEMKLEAMPGTIFQRYALTWREPYLFNSQYGLTNSAYFFTRSYAEYNEDRVGARISVDRRLDPIWRASASARVENVNVKDVPSWATPALTDDRGHSFVLGLRGGLVRDTRDSYVTPTSGSILDLGVEQVLGDYKFPIATAEYTKFFTTEWLQRNDGGGKHVLAVRSQLSVEGGNAPVFERFYAGGFRSLRGFTFRGVGPTENELKTGGTFAFLNTLEYQVPLNAKESLFFVTFVDHGTVEQNVAIRDYRVSVGFGFRVAIPALGPVPVAFDFAFPISKRGEDNQQVFAFYVGLFGGQ